MILHTKDPGEQAWFMSQLGATWFIDGGFGTEVPAGTKKVFFVGSLPGVNPSENGPTPSQLFVLARDNPGGTWVVANEPNRRPGYDVNAILDKLHDSYRAIRLGDPTARIVSPPLLNWLFTCTGCPGFGRGTEWAEEFRIRYFLKFGEEPPVDIWAVNAYPLDWTNIPTLEPNIVINQIAGLRTWMNERASQAGKPIWVTEIGLHWAWDGLRFDQPGCNKLPFPSGSYRETEAGEYLRTVYDWLQANADALNIDRWFQYISYHDIASCNTDGYAGISLFDGPLPGASITPAGEIFRDRALNIP